MTTCPMCAEDVGASDAVCPHCGHLLRASAAPPSAPAHAPVVSSADGHSFGSMIGSILWPLRRIARCSDTAPRRSASRVPYAQLCR